MAKDYLTLGPGHPLLTALSDMVGRSYRKAAERGRVPDGRRGWHFWTGGSGRDLIVCGHISKSQDSLGRPYPFLLLGEGELEDWREGWDFLPLVLAESWKRMAQITARDFESLSAMRGALASLPAPIRAWADIRKAQVPPTEASFNEPGPTVGSLYERVRLFLDDPNLSMRVIVNGPAGSVRPPGGSARQSEVPQAVFMGGTGPEESLQVFFRPLAPADFVKMWTGS